MAIIKSPVWSEVRGSIGGTTYARNKSGLYARNRSKPVNPNTANQSNVRSQFQTQALAFSQLSVDDVLAWNQFAQGYPAINRVGDTYTPSGKQMFIMCNLNLLSAGQPAITVPPYAVPIVPSCVVGVDDPLVIVNTAGAITSLGVGIGTDYPTAIGVIQATPNMQPARQSYRNRMRQMSAGATGGLQTFATAFNNYFGNPAVTAGQIINLRASTVASDTGIASAWIYFQGVIPAALP